MESFWERSGIPSVALGLGFAGLIPFLIAALSQWAALGPITPEFGYRAGVIYGAVILSFLGGIRWGVAVNSSYGERQSVEFAASNIAALAGWLSLLLPPVMCLSLLISGFLLQGLWDLMSSEDGILPEWYGKLRTVLTVIAVLALTAILVRAVIS
jgi:Protein of unknown function (DUF3429)